MLDWLRRWLFGRETRLLETLCRKADEIMATQAQLKAGLDALKGKVEAQTTAIGGIKVLIVGLKQQIADALANGNVPQETLDEVNQILATTEANASGLADALDANVPPTP